MISYCCLLSVAFITTTHQQLDIGVSRSFEILRHDTNQVEICISNYGKFGLDETGNYPGCWWPTGTNHTYIDGAGIWFGTVDALTGDTLVTIGFMPSGGVHEFTPGLSGWGPDDSAAIIFMYPQNWPAPLDTFPTAPQSLVSHNDSWCCFNDSNPAWHVMGDTRPIGIEVYQTVYAWDAPYVEDMIFFTYEVKNVSGDVLSDCYLGICTNCDIGNEVGSPNDVYAVTVYREYFIGGDTVILDNIVYQWQEWEEPGTPPWLPGTIGFDLLQTPFDLVAGMDKDGDGILDQFERDSVYYVNNLPASMWDVDLDGVPDWRDPSQWPQMGMTALKRYTYSFEPTTDPKRYLSLAGYNHVTGVYEPIDTFSLQPTDQRFLLACGPFDLEPDSIVTLIFAVMFADWMEIYERPDTAIALIDQYAEDYYNMYWYLYTGIEENCESRISNCEMRILPNPVSNTGVVSFSLPTAASVSLKLYNALGQLVERVYDGFKPAGVHEFALNAQHLPQGTYFVVLETPTVRQEQSVVLVR